MPALIVRWLGEQAYLPCLQQMQRYTADRNAQSSDEIWLLEHPPVFTQGQNGKPEHLLAPGNIPVIPIDRGGQVTYHGPGQLMVYTLIDIQRKKWGIRQFVQLLLQSVTDMLNEHYHLNASCQTTLPGVYLNQQKICSIGLRVRQGRAYHGMALNVAMDLEPFHRIHPCGISTLQMTQLRDHVPETGEPLTPHSVGSTLLSYLTHQLAYQSDDTIIKKPYTDNHMGGLNEH